MLKLCQGRVAVRPIRVRLVLAVKGLDRDSGERVFARWRPTQAGLSECGSERCRASLIHDDCVLVELSVMMQYLNATLAALPRQPSDFIDRARMRIWMKRVDEYLHAGNVTPTQTVLHAVEMRIMSSTELEAYDCGISNQAIHARQQAGMEQGLDRLSAAPALQFDGRAAAEVQPKPERDFRVAGDDEPRAKTVMIRCVVRFTMVALSNMWAQSRRRVSAWYERIRTRLVYASAILAFLGNADLDANSDLRGWAWTKAHASLKTL